MTLNEFINTLNLDIQRFVQREENLSFLIQTKKEEKIVEFDKSVEMLESDIKRFEDYCLLGKPLVSKYQINIPLKEWQEQFLTWMELEIRSDNDT